MPTLIRRDMYDSVSWAGAVDSMQWTTGINPHISNFDTSAFKQQSVLGGPGQYERAMATYTNDTTHFGMLASFYGPAMRAAQAMPIRQLFDTENFTNFGSDLQVNSQGRLTVNVMTDWELSAKQSVPGSVHYFRKMTADMQPTNMFGFNTALQTMTYGTKSGTAGMVQNYFDSLHNAQRIASSTFPQPKVYSGTIGTMPKPPAPIAFNSQVYTSPVQGGFSPNINLFGSWGVQTYLPGAKLWGPGTGGAFTMPTVHIR